MSRASEMAAKDLRGFKSAEHWPMPVLPIKRRKADQSMPELAYIRTPAPTGPITIFHGNVGGGFGAIHVSATDREETFESAEALQAAGWIVD